MNAALIPTAGSSIFHPILSSADVLRQYAISFNGQTYLIIIVARYVIYLSLSGAAARPLMFARSSAGQNERKKKQANTILWFHLWIR